MPRRALLGRRRSDIDPLIEFATGVERRMIDDSSADGGRKALDVHALDEQVVELFRYVSGGLQLVSAALVADDRDAARTIASTERRLDALYEQVRDRAELELVAGRGYTIKERWLLLLVAQIVPEIERSGDLVQHIASRASHGVGAWLRPDVVGLVERMGAIGSAMWTDAAEAYRARDATAWHALRMRDDMLDDLHVRFTEALASSNVSVAAAIELGLVARFLERLGDHAVNVARRLELVAFRTAECEFSSP